MTNAGQLYAALVKASGDGHATVADMTATGFCDSAGFQVLLRAHRQALAEGGELRADPPGLPGQMCPVLARPLSSGRTTIELRLTSQPVRRFWLHRPATPSRPTRLPGHVSVVLGR